MRSRRPFAGKPRETGRMVDLVHLVCFVHLVSRVQPNKPNRPNKQEKPDSILLDHFSEVFDRATEGILELYLRFPFQERARPTDIGPSDFRIISRQRMMGDLAR
jgi:hypothetical protein